ncbi:MEDS domain-containing protein [Streptomyces sp. XM83C]|jgi:anti-sigma regulatory factor (Ser/Thr protein kinase)|uniref:Anti-sigma factor RsbA family regulatory protein n=1 Tax=Streptomyces thermocoprophilus TaxID=78356 RepID=A0ABV5VIM8_9ACTN|nr:anti-sigma factor RsbA family regulatory protein [Streptomyces sp. XM83C]MCK1822989.1 MEDS domain-containing protein [Streptomyces sp. XM83C]
MSAADLFDHPALFYRGEAEYLAGVLPFVRDALAAEEPVAVAVPGENLDLVRDALGACAGAVRLLDMREAGRNPGRILPAVLHAFADAQPPGRRVRIVGEPVWAGRSSVEYPACVQHEALINAAFRGRAVTVLCPYDAGRLDPGVLADAYVTHPTVVPAGATVAHDSRAYAPEQAVARYNVPLPPAPPGAPACAFTAAALSPARHHAVAEGRRLGLTGVRLDDLALVTAELTTNSVVHGGGAGTLWVWAESGYVVCEVRDDGRLTDPLAGRRPAPRERRGGRGLLLVNLVSDLVRTHTGDDGTTVRAYFAV